VALAILLPLAAVAASNSLVFAQASCAVQINGSATATLTNSGSNSYGYSAGGIQLTVPVGAGCPNMGSQLWATGSVYDPTMNANVGSANGVLNSNGGYYTGQLVFSLPPSVLEHQLQVSITVYNSAQNGAVVGTTSQTITIHGTYYPPNSSYGNTYPSYYNYPYYPYYSYGYPSYYYYNGGYYYYYYPYYYYYGSYPNNYNGSCYNGQMLLYYNGAYYYVNCYSYWHNH